MSRPHDGHRPFFPLGNPFRRIIPKGSYLSPELLHLQNSFEETLTERLNNLSKNMHSDILSLSWMKCALVSLSETHKAIQSLITDLQFPVSDWDERWMDMYLDNSVKLLDICNGFSSELGRLDRTRLLLQYILHLLGRLTGCPSQEQLKQAHASLCEWTEQDNSKSPKLNNSSSILRGLAKSLYLTEVKNSGKGKVLMRAMYGVKVQTIFICSVLSAILSGSMELLMDLPVFETFMWAGAFNKLQTDVNSELRRLSTCRKVMLLKELELVDQCVRELTSLTGGVGQCERDAQQNSVDIDKTEHVGLQETNSNNLPKMTILKEIISDLGKNAGGLANSLDNLSKEVGDFFGIVLAGRDELLCNLRMPAGKKGRHM